MIYPAPKPTRRKRSRKKGSAFPKVRDTGLTSWVVTQDCVLAGCWTTRRLSENDIDSAVAPSFLLRVIGGFWHRCWGDKTPMHVGQHRAKGAPDRNRVVCACQAAHQEYDEHRSRWYRGTRLTEKRLQERAHVLTAQYEAEAP